MIQIMKNCRVIIFSVIGIGFLLIPQLLFAQGGFAPLSNIPGVTDQTNIGDFFNAAFRLGLVVAATLAVVMITLGGIEYMTTDSISKKSGGREKIQNAVIGLLIALLTWIILDTINPNLRSFNFNAPRTNVDTSQVQPTTTGENVEKKATTQEALPAKKCHGRWGRTCLF